MPGQPAPAFAPFSRVYLSAGHGEPVPGIGKIRLELQGVPELLLRAPPVTQAEVGPPQPIEKAVPVGPGRESPQELIAGAGIVPR